MAKIKWYDRGNLAASFRKFLSWVSTLFLSTIVISLFAKPFENWLIAQNYYELVPVWVASLLDKLKALSGYPLFQFFSVGIASATAGAWLNFAAAKRDNEKSGEQANELIVMRNALSNIHSEFWEGLRVGPSHSFQFVNAPTRISLKAIYARLQRLGIPTPPTDEYEQPWQYNLLQLGYLETVIPFARAGLIPELKIEIKSYMDSYRRDIARFGSETALPDEIRRRINGQYRSVLSGSR